MSSPHTPRHRAAARRPLPRVGLGAAAVAVVGVLLLGGQGSLAKWAGSATDKPGSFTTGKLSLTPKSGHGADGCDGWTFSQTGGTSTGAVTASTPLQPGDVIVDNCYYTLTAQGGHLAGTVGVSSSSLPAGYASVSATYVVNGRSGAAFTSADDGQQVQATIAITIDPNYATQPANPTSFTPTLGVTLTQKAPA